MRKKPCVRFFNNGSCTYGVHCFFSHSDPDTSTISSAKTNGKKGFQPKKCNTFWETGHCKFDFECKFPHIANPALKSKPTKADDTSKGEQWKPANGVGKVQAVDRAFPAFSAVQSRVSDDLLVPSEFIPPHKVKGTIMEASREGRRLTSAVLVEEIVMALNSSNKNNELWDFDERQSLLGIVAKTPGEFLLRVAEIIRWPEVSTKGCSRERISFQSCYMGIVAYMTSEAVLKSAAHTHVRYTKLLDAAFVRRKADKNSALYGLIDYNLEIVLSTIEENITACLEARTFRDRSPPVYLRTKVLNIVTGLQIFKPIAVFVAEYITKFRSALTSHPELVDFVSTLVEQFEAWEDLLLRGKFADALTDRDTKDKEYFLKDVKKHLQILQELTAKSFQLANGDKDQLDKKPFTPSLGVLAYTEREYDGPGDLSNEGPRHDNDHEDIADISIPPTTDELLSDAEPYLPVNLPGARHHLPADSIDKILDIQFRLLRADATTSLAKGIKLVLEDLNHEDFANTQIGNLLRSGGGRFVASSDWSDRVMLPLIANVQFSGFDLDHKHGLVIHVRADSPPGDARSGSPGTRKRFWESGKRLPQGGLVALVTKERGLPATVSLAILTSRSDTIKHLDRPGRSGIEFGLAFVDPEEGLRAAETLRARDDSKGDVRVLIESPVMYESAEYIRHGDLQGKAIALPQYATVPGFIWDLKSLLKPEHQGESCSFDPSNTHSIASAREVLHAHGKLDPSQTDAVLHSLTRELTLIQGPPGTGKTFTGVELLRLLIENGIGPIVLLAFTNHALDHILRAIHNADVTRSMLRLGSRSKDEVVSQYSLETLERVGKKDSSLHHQTGMFHGEMKDLEEEMKKVSQAITSQIASDDQIMEYLEMDLPLLKVNIANPPDWANMLYEHAADTSGWKTIGKSSGKVSLWSFWLEGMDLAHLHYLENKPPVVKTIPLKNTMNRFEQLEEVGEKDSAFSDGDHSSTSSEDVQRDRTFDFMFAEPNVEDWEIMSDDETNSMQNKMAGPGPDIDSDLEDTPESTLPEAIDVVQDKAALLEYFDLKVLPKIPQTDRKLSVLLEDGDVWSFSLEERGRVAEFVMGRAKTELDEDMLAKFVVLAKKHAEARKRYAEARDNIRVKLLKNIKLLGSTTTGAAKLPTVLTGFSPQVLVIEEAGQVLEAHILATLFPTIKHVIAIGDPLQLRPNLSCYEFSVDSAKGKDMYRFDVSLMERLSSGGLPMSQLLVQRRMRPQISSLIRIPQLYPRLEDHELVHDYPDVRGMGKNVFFLDHRNRDSRVGEDGGSRHNNYEVKMACDLARYLLKQGAYNEEGDIVILCAYLGQLLKLRDALKDEYMVILDERDQREIDKRGADEVEEATPQVRKVSIGRHILLRTIDNFQGEEAKIIILSLVRNAGSTEDDNTDYAPGSIGFLKSNNRVNVALSRAKHGLYIMGHAEQLAAQSPMWETIVDQLVETEAIGTGWPIACANHPETLRFVDRPGQIQLLSPDGGCMLKCGKAMSCGHICEQKASIKCHPDDQDHVLIKCHKPCGRLLQPCGHPCAKRCFEDCGKCQQIVHDVQLPCGHKMDLPCEDTAHLELVECQTKVLKQFKTCEHEKLVPCGDDISTYVCTAQCGQPRDCCGRTCTAECYLCQGHSPKPDVHPTPQGLHIDPWDELAAAEVATTTKINRIKHQSHPCGKILDICGHQCSGKCEKDHVHPVCNAPCLQHCAHKKCSKTCKTPCAPCQEACQWNCQHRKCSMPCAMPCDRLPCDEPCSKLLKCGHSCPSVCGEPCESQICLQCATSNQLNQVVDFVMQATLAEVIADETEGETRFITLTCGHLFTVETLDGHIDFSQCYEVTAQGIRVGLKMPDAGKFTARPTCPTCRGPISSPRYNRIIKRALLDIQEQHAITDASRDVNQARNAVAGINFDDIKRGVEGGLTGISAPKHTFMPKAPRIDSLLRLNPDDRTCIVSDTFSEQLEDLFVIFGPLNREWRKMLDKPLRVYKQLGRIINRRALPHVIAYENAITSIHRHEVDMARQRVDLSKPASGPSEPQLLERAMRVAKMRVGAPFPVGEMRFKIEAIHETIKIRLALAPISEEFARVLHVDPMAVGAADWKKRHLATNAIAVAQKFKIVSSTILRSCRRDVDLAANLCDKSDAKRLWLSTELLAIQVHFAMCRTTASDMVRRHLQQKPTFRQEQADWVLDQRQQDIERFEAGVAGILRTGEDGAVRSLKLEELARDTIQPAARVLFDEWNSYAVTLREDVFYSTVSLEEKMSIAKAVLDAHYGYAGRFYQCPSGHTFTIGECGQAMGEADCPECGARIGGGGHQIRTDNSRDLEFERLAMEAGAMRNPHVM